MREATLTLLMQLESSVSQPRTSSHNGSIILPQRNLMNTIKLNHERPILTTKTHRSIAMTTTLSRNLDVTLYSTENSCLNILRVLGVDNGAWGDGHTQIVRLNGVGP